MSEEVQINSLVEYEMNGATRRGRVVKTDGVEAAVRPHPHSEVCFLIGHRHLKVIPELGTRAEAQQRVLAEGVSHYQSWRDVDARIREVEHQIIRERGVAETQ